MNLINREEAWNLSEKGRAEIRKLAVNQVNDGIREAAKLGLTECNVILDMNSPAIMAFVDNELKKLHKVNVRLNSKDTPLGVSISWAKPKAKSKSKPKKK